MKEVQNKINALRPYVTGMKFVEDYLIVEAVFKPKWLIAEDPRIGHEMNAKNSYRFFSNDDTVTIDDILDFIENIINLNLEREQKVELLKEKVEELKVLFNQKHLEELKKLKFIIPEPDIVDNLELSEMPNKDDSEPENDTKEEEELAEVTEEKGE